MTNPGNVFESGILPVIIVSELKELGLEQLVHWPLEAVDRQERQTVVLFDQTKHVENCLLRPDVARMIMHRARLLPANEHELDCIGCLRGLVEGVQACISCLHGLVEGIQAFIGYLQGLVQGIQAFIGYLRGLVEGVQAFIGCLRGLVEGVQAFIGCLRGLVEGVQAFIGCLWGLVEGVKALISSLHGLVECSNVYWLLAGIG